MQRAPLWKSLRVMFCEAAAATAARASRRAEYVARTPLAGHSRDWRPPSHSPRTKCSATENAGGPASARTVSDRRSESARQSNTTTDSSVVPSSNSSNRWRIVSDCKLHIESMNIWKYLLVD